MKAVLFTDNTLPLALGPLCELLNSVCNKSEFTSGKEKLRIGTPVISFPESYGGLSAELIAEVETFDFAFLCTSIPYDNNFFFEIKRNMALISFSGWNLLTDLSVTNGLVYFIASIICDECEIGGAHEENTGCVNDFWWDKTGVDIGMRAAFICQDCRNTYKGDAAILHDVRNLLDLVSSVSRIGKDIMDAAPSLKGSSTSHFDVFLCHNSDDKPAIRKLNVAFKQAGINTWLDEDQLEPGFLWQPELEKQITNVRAACVFVGANGIGPWQNAEIRAFLSEFVNRSCPVIPVILPDATAIPQLPIFLKQMTWIDLRKDYQRGLLRLVGTLRGR